MSKPESEEATALSQLQAEQGHLLDKIDELRTIGVGGLVELPQLIVCGNQSAGKSSVLEAISRVRFPTKSSVCTRFATEVSLRRLPASRFKVSIEPGPSRKNEEDKAKLRAFAPTEVTDIKNLPNLIDQAKACMVGADADFTDDILKVEISGPDQPELTLVDLPGLYSATSADQGPDGIPIVRGITERYMKNKRSIILAVISARAEFHSQDVLDIALKFDAGRERTVGIVTQPDQLDAHSEEEEFWLKIAKNEKNALKLGWHTLRNRSFSTRNASDDERDQAEREFFSRDNWNSVPRDRVGISSLRQRLSSILLTHIRSNLPGLIEDIQSKISDRQSRLLKMGNPRSTVQQQRGFLLDLSSRFDRIVAQALNGLYTDGFFGGLESKPKNTQEHRLRAVIRQLNEYFAENMEDRGCQEWIDDSKASPKEPVYKVSPISARDNPYAYIRTPKIKKRSELEKSIAEIARQSRGIELPGSANQLLIGDLFREQSKPWETLARHHLEESWESVNSFVSNLLLYLTDENTYQQVMGVVLYPQLDEMKSQLLAKLEELTAYNKRGHPLPLGRVFLDNVREAKSARQISRLKQTIEDGSQDLEKLSLEDVMEAAEKLESSYSQFAAAEIIDQMQAYYDIAITIFINNVATLAIENCLLEPLGRIFTSQMMNNMEDSQIKSIAAEPASSTEERERLSRELEQLGKGLKLLSRFNTSRPSKPSWKATLASKVSGAMPERDPASDSETNASQNNSTKSPGTFFGNLSTNGSTPAFKAEPPVNTHVDQSSFMANRSNLQEVMKKLSASAQAERERIELSDGSFSSTPGPTSLPGSRVQEPRPAPTTAQVNANLPFGFGSRPSGSQPVSGSTQANAKPLFGSPGSLGSHPSQSNPASGSTHANVNSPFSSFGSPGSHPSQSRPASGPTQVNASPPFGLFGSVGSRPPEPKPASTTTRTENSTASLFGGESGGGFSSNPHGSFGAGSSSSTPNKTSTAGRNQAQAGSNLKGSNPAELPIVR